MVDEPIENDPEAGQTTTAAEAAENDRRLRREIEKTLEAKAEGKLGYRSLDEVAARYADDARSSVE